MSACALCALSKDAEREESQLQMGSRKMVIEAVTFRRMLGLAEASQEMLSPPRKAKGTPGIGVLMQHYIAAIVQGLDLLNCCIHAIFLC